MRFGFIAMAAFALMAPCLKADIQVSVDTSNFAGDPATVLFDFTAGGGTPDNTVTISNVDVPFIFNETDTGSVTGTMPTAETLSDSSFFSESDLSVVLGTTFTFDFASTNVAPDPGAFPDEFSFYILNFVTGQSLLPSNDPTGAESLVTIDLTGSTTPVVTVYSNLLATGPVPPPSTAPEPSTTVLLSAVLMLPLLSRNVRRRLRRSLPAAGAVVCTAAVSLACLPAAQAGNIVTGVGQDANFTITFSGLRLNRSTNTFVTIASITNNSSSAINGPFYLGITNISNPDVTLAGGGGNLQDGYPFATLNGVEAIEAGQTVTEDLYFNNPDLVAFTIQARIYDAASGPPVATLQCPQPVDAPLGLPVWGSVPTPLIFTPPTDSLGRVASCVPASGTGITQNTTVNCSSNGGASLPAFCSFIQGVMPVLTIVVNDPPPPPQPPFEAQLALITCPQMAPVFAPGAPPPTGLNANLYCPMELGGPAGQATFTIWNYGPNPAINSSLTLSFGPLITQQAWQFSQAATCQAPVQVLYPFTLLNFIGGYHIGYTETCSFADIEPNTGVNVTVGIDVPAGTEAPDIQATLAVDPTQNTDPDTAGMAISVPVSPQPFQSVTVPVSVSERITQQSGCNYSDEPGFAILLDTCGVPTAVTTGLVQGFLGAATMITGAGELSIIFDGTQNVIFQSVEEVGFIN